MAQDPRLSVVQALAELHRRRSYSNIVLDQLLRTAELSTADRSLASRLFYGVIERRLTLDHVLSRASSVGQKCTQRPSLGGQAQLTVGTLPAFSAPFPRQWRSAYCFSRDEPWENRI